MVSSAHLTDYANDISKLTFEMEKVCRTKEVFFCNSINITPVEFRCLRYLLKAIFPQVKELANNMDLTPSRITSLLNSLEKKGYVVREIAKEDRRIIKVTLTPIGRDFAQNVQNKYVKFHEDILSSIDDENKLENMLFSLQNFQITLETFLNQNKGKIDE